MGQRWSGGHDTAARAEKRSLGHVRSVSILVEQHGVYRAYKLSQPGYAVAVGKRKHTSSYIPVWGGGGGVA